MIRDVHERLKAVSLPTAIAVQGTCGGRVVAIHLA